MRLGFAAFALVVVGGCSLGIDEDQIDGAGAGSTTSTDAASSTSGASVSSGSGSSGSGSSASSGASSSTTTSAASTTASSSSTGGGTTVKCTSGNNPTLVDCAPGQVCCVDVISGNGSCSNSCAFPNHSYACDGPEDCPGGVCCAPQEEDGDTACTANCADDDTVCTSSADCADECIEDFPGPLGQAYSTCF